MMTRRDWLLLQTPLLYFPLGCCGFIGKEKLERRAASLLVERYETVVSARSAVLSQLHFDRPGQEFGKMYLGLPFVYLIGGLKAVGPKTLGVLERNSETVLTGAKEFAGPAGLGMVSSRACYIAILRHGAAPVLASEFGKVRVTTVDGGPVWTWSIPPSEGYSVRATFYAAVIGDAFLLTNREPDFRSMATQFAKGAAQPGASGGHDLSSLMSHRYWAYHPVRQTVMASAANALPLAATRLELFTQFDDDKLLFNIVVSGDSPALAGLPSSELIHFAKVGQGVWQAAIPLAATDMAVKRQITAAVFETMSYFGYSVVL